MSSRKREDVSLKPEINKCYFERICLYLWQISVSVTFVTIIAELHARAKRARLGGAP